MLGSTGDARSQAINALAGILARYEGEPASLDNEDLPDSPLLHLANNVVLDDQANPQQGFLDRLVRYYNAGVRVTDLASAQGGRVLDAWVREHTGGRIKESAIEPDPDLYLVLQDAILLAARWQQEFDPNDTGKGPFTSSTGSVQTVDLMHGQFDLKYAEADGWITIEMPYQEGFTARIVLPPEGADPAAIGATRLAALNRAIDAAPATSVSVVLPRFDTRSRVDLNQVLQVRGLAAIFDPGSRSFEAISTDVPLFVGQAVQQASITVGEQGTVAAAVTEIGMMAGSMPIKPDHEFVADRPFLMVVQEATTGWDLIQTVIHSID